MNIEYIYTCIRTLESWLKESNSLSCSGPVVVQRRVRPNGDRPWSGTSADEDVAAAAAAAVVADDDNMSVLSRSSRSNQSVNQSDTAPSRRHSFHKLQPVQPADYRYHRPANSQ